MNYVKHIKGYSKAKMNREAISQGKTVFQMDYNCDECGSDLYRCGALSCAVCQGARPMSTNNQVLAREMYLTGRYNLTMLSTRLNVPRRDVRWHLVKSGLVKKGNHAKVKLNMKNERVIMNLSRQGLINQGHSDIRASSILQIFKDHTPKTMRAVTRWQDGQIMTITRQVMK